MARQSAAVALALLPGDEWVDFHDVPWPGRPGALIDHVAVGPAGVFVIVTSHLGENTQIRRDVLRRNGRRRDKVLGRALQAAEALGTEIPDVDQLFIRPVVCFAREEMIMGWGRKVMVCSTASVVPMLRNQPTVVNAAERDALCASIEVAIRAANLVPGSRPPGMVRPRHLETKPEETPQRGARRAPGKTSWGFAKLRG
jgi:hypothetical protein